MGLGDRTAQLCLAPLLRTIEDAAQGVGGIKQKLKLP